MILAFLTYENGSFDVDMAGLTDGLLKAGIAVVTCLVALLLFYLAVRFVFRALGVDRVSGGDDEPWDLHDEAEFRRFLAQQRRNYRNAAGLGSQYRKGARMSMNRWNYDSARSYRKSEGRGKRRYRKG